MVIVFPGKECIRGKIFERNWKYGIKYFHYFACKKKWNKKKMFLFLRKSKLNIYIYVQKIDCDLWIFQKSISLKTNFETKKKFILHFFLSLYVK